MVSFRSYPWEGKGLPYYIKDSLKNRPAMFVTSVLFILCAPAGLTYMWYTEDERTAQFSRFRTRYIVYRDDDPRVRNIVKFDDKGNRIYLEPRTN